MPKAVFTTKVNPAYDDLPEQRYHFPRRYLRAARQALNNWIVYYEPRRSSAHLSSSGGRQSYFATAYVESIEPDPQRDDHYYAYVRDYLEFDTPVRFRENRFYYESGLQKEDGSTNKGRFGLSVRSLPDTEYRLILSAGFSDMAVEMETTGVYEEDSGVRDLVEIADRSVIQQVSYRPFRDRVFSTAVRAAYDNTCAVTGLRIINGGGRPEVQAAHIKPVAKSGPDSMRNGLALCGTAHWMFDRGLISIADDYRLLLRDGAIPGDFLRIINEDRRLTVPDVPSHRPHPNFLKYHREQVFRV
ncbi:MAG: restriction endonuclease [Gemmatimonadales bacterium]|nr:restriction endonuclease [Gemmatimonadales bacterium]MYG20319.1 restriction endonuclease [Gemmatimonadales bacterium]MYH10539.1 restriction endonuclease [Gemmatimonadales bacterium]